MEAYWVWWLFALVLVIAEMLTGTFYLLAIATGLAAAGLAAYLGVAWGGQAVFAALLCSACVAGIFRWKQQHSNVNEQANLAYDIGPDGHVVHWSDDRHARVSYRGAEWDVELAAHDDRLLDLVDGCEPYRLVHTAYVDIAERGVDLEFHAKRILGVSDSVPCQL